jgi:hypothetical protein
LQNARLLDDIEPGQRINFSDVELPQSRALDIYLKIRAKVRHIDSLPKSEDLFLYEPKESERRSIDRRLADRRSTERDLAEV